MPVYVDIITSGQSEKEWLNVFQEVIPNLVETPDKACIKVIF